jgi:hypothetical protein
VAIRRPGGAAGKGCRVLSVRDTSRKPCRKALSLGLGKRGGGWGSSKPTALRILLEVRGAAPEVPGGRAPGSLGDPSCTGP